MTLLQLIQTIEGIAERQPAVNMIVRDDVYDINGEPAARYGAFAWTQGQHVESVENDIRRFRFSFFYVDRLTRNHGNKAEIQSVGCDVLSNIIRTLGEELEIESWTLDTFTSEKFVDQCAGVWASVEIGVSNSAPCPELFEKGGYLLTAEGWKVLDIDGKYILVRQ